MNSRARLLYEKHLENAANDLRMASTVLILNNAVDAAGQVDRLQAYLLSELDRSVRGRRPMTVRIPSLVDGALSRSL